MLCLTAVVVTIALVVALLLCLLTGDRKYLRFAFRVFLFALAGVLAVLLLMALERVAVLV